VTPDTTHHALSIDVFLPHVNNNLICEFSHRIFAAGNYTLLYNIPSAYDWTSVYKASFVDAALASLNAAGRGNVEKAIPRGYSCKSKFPPWFSYNLRCYIDKKNYFHRRFEKKLAD
jgi:hypothetical protein